MAAPHVAGTAALFKAENPHATPQQIIDTTLKSTSKPTTTCHWVTSQGDVDILKEPLLLENPLYLILLLLVLVLLVVLLSKNKTYLVREIAE